jgi:hypothetical protein
MSKDLEDGGLGLLEGNSKVAPREKEDGNPIEIRAGYLPNTNISFYYYTNLLITSIKNYINFKVTAEVNMSLC